MGMINGWEPLETGHDAQHPILQPDRASNHLCSGAALITTAPHPPLQSWSCRMPVALLPVQPDLRMPSPKIPLRTHHPPTTHHPCDKRNAQCIK